MAKKSKLECRVTVNFTLEQMQVLQILSERNGSSVALIVRQAVQKLIEREFVKNDK